MEEPNTAQRPLARVVFVTGKGGVGKTTVAAGLAAAPSAKRAGSVFVEFGDGEPGRRLIEGVPQVRHFVIKPQEAIHRMAADVFGSALVAKVVTANFAIKRLIQVAPGLRELAQLDAVRQVANQYPNRRIVVDMPATGHGLAWLRAPRQMRELLRRGPLHDVAACVCRELINEHHCSVVIVALPERMVLKETLELCADLRREVELAPARLVINRIPDPFSEQAWREATLLAGQEGPRAQAAAQLAQVIATRRAARAEAVEVVEPVTQMIDAPPVLLPEAPGDPNATAVAQWFEERAPA